MYLCFAPRYIYEEVAWCKEIKIELDSIKEDKE